MNKKLLRLFGTVLILCLTSGSVYSQHLIKGVVKSDDGEPIIGASISVKEVSGLGTSSDIDGGFSLELPSENLTLDFMFLGYEPQGIRVTSQTFLDVVMKSSSFNMDELVVVGYGTQKKVNLSGAVSSIMSKDLENRPVSNVGSALQGVVGNLNIETGGRPGEASSINIRGAGSINSDGAGYGESPLIMIDNVASSTGDLARLNPTDIASISVLKDASASAIYGARAAFGVILVTTKSGTSSDLTVTLNYNFSVSDATRLTQNALDPYVQTYYKSLMGAGWGSPQYTEAEIAYAKQVRDDPTNNPAAIQSFVDPSKWQYFGSTDWNNIVFEPATANTVNVSVSQQTDKASFYISGAYLSQDGAIKIGDEKYTKANFRSKVDFKVTDWLKLTTNLAYSQSEYDAPQYAKGKDYGSIFYAVNKTNVLFTPYNPDGTHSYYGADIYGNMENGGRYVVDESDVVLQFGTDISLIKDMWSVKADVTFKQRNYNELENKLTTTFGDGPNAPNVLYDGGNPWHDEEWSKTNFTSINIFTNFNKVWGRHTVEALLGFNQELSIYDWASAYRDGLISSSVPNLGTAAGGDQRVDGGAEDWATRGAFFRLNYNFGNKYIAEINGRYDGSSRFPKNDRFAFFPSFSAAYIISEEPFFEPIKEVVNHLKIRASIGLLGNQNVGAYDYMPILPTRPLNFNNDSDYPGPIVGGTIPVGGYAPGLVSGSLTWEKVNTKNLGLDINLLNNKITASFDVYQRDTEDMLVPGRILPGVLGTIAPKINGANMKTNGWELGLNYRDQFEVAGSPFGLGVSFTLADNKSEITKFDNPNGNLDEWYAGAQFGDIWGLTSDGFFKTQAEIDAIDQTQITAHLGVRPIEPGDLKFKDLNDDDKITQGEWSLDDHGDYTIIGNVTPRFPYSFRFNFDWKGFDLSLFFQGVGQRDYYAHGGQYSFWGIYTEPWTNVTESNLNHWTPENPDAYFPRMKSYLVEDDKDLAIPQTRYLQDASYLRLKNLTFGYTLPARWTDKMGVSKVRISFSGENLALWTKLSDNLDPENLTGASYPINKVYSFAVNLNF